MKWEREKLPMRVSDGSMRLLNADGTLGKAHYAPAYTQCPRASVGDAGATPDNDSRRLESYEYSPVVNLGIPSFQTFSSPTGHFSLPVASVSGV